MNKRRKLLSLILSAGIVASAFPSSGTGATSDSIAFFNSKKSILEMKEYDEAYDTNHDGVVNVFDVIRENKEVFQEESYTDLKVQIHSLETQIEILTQKLIEKEDKSHAESDLSEINTALSGKVDMQEGKQLSSNDYTDEDKNKLDSLGNYNDSDIKSAISSINTELSSINGTVSGKVDQQEGKQLSSNDYTDSEKEKLDGLENYDDTKINEKIDSLVQSAYEEKKVIESSIDNKVDKEEGKQLSSNDYTDEEKQKLESLYNYDDSEIKTELQNQTELIYNLTKSQENISNNTYSFGAFYKFGIIGDSLSVGHMTNPLTGETKYRNIPFSWGQYLARREGNICLNFGVSGETLDSWWSDGRKEVFANPDNLCQAYIICLGLNDNEEIGSISDVDWYDYNNNTDTFYERYARIVQYVRTMAPDAPIFIMTLPIPFMDDAKNLAFKEIAESQGVANTYLVDLTKYNEYYNYIFKTHYVSYHSTAIGYDYISVINYIAISNVMREHTGKFENIGFIPYGSNDVID